MQVTAKKRFMAQLDVTKSDQYDRLPRQIRCIPLQGLPDEDLYCVLRALTSGSSITESYMKEIYEKDYSLLESVLTSKNSNIKVGGFLC